MKILGVKVDDLIKEQVLQKVESFLKDGQSHYIVTANPEFLVKAQTDEVFRKILNQADLVVPDGIGLILASWFLGQPLKERIAGVDLMEDICQKAAQKKWSVFLLGAGQGVAEKATDNLKKKYPGLEAWSVLNSDSIEQSGIGRPAIIFVALGAVKQEKWINDNLNKMSSVELAMGVGGAFDFISGRIKRAPRFFQSIGLEWLWRLFCQPRRIRRIWRSVIKFPYLVIKSGRGKQDD